VPTIQHYCHILENTYTISCIKPFVGNKRKEVVSNPVYYFIDNGFRNQALRQFSRLSARSDTDLLIESAVFQEILKFRAQNFGNFDIYYWRTQSGAEVDFVLYFNKDNVLPIEAKYRNMQRATIPRSLRSFIAAYSPKQAIIITKQFSAIVDVDGCSVYFIPFENIAEMIEKIASACGKTRSK